MGQQGHGNYYQVLGIDETATELAIKAAYRKMVLQYHPDRSELADAVVVFTRIQRAYEVLSHPALRQEYDRQLALNQEVAEYYISAPTRYTSHLISMHASATQVKVGEPFTVLFRCPRRIQSFKLRGLEHFEVLQSVEHEMPYQGSVITQTHFVLRALEEGTFRLGPASGYMGSIEYVSGTVDLKVVGQYVKPSWENRSWMGKYYSIVMLCLAMIFPAMIIYNMAVYGYRKSGTENERVYLFRGGDRPKTGDMASNTPINQEGWGQVVINNQSKKDALLILFNEHYVLARSQYIRGGDKYTMAHLPVGTYDWHIIMGIDSETRTGRSSQPGGFSSGTTIGNDKKELPVFRIWEKETDEAVFFSIYRVNLMEENGTDKVNIESDTGFYLTK